MNLTYDPPILLLGTYSKKLKTWSRVEFCTARFITFKNSQKTRYRNEVNEVENALKYPLGI